uniref:Uncharacterized protein n=1 Tax=mine drainage metagenome TaxID=410659 RepID=E6QHL3_9ZZZZ
MADSREPYREQYQNPRNAREAALKAASVVEQALAARRVAIARLRSDRNAEALAGKGLAGDGLDGARMSQVLKVL